tara:strand:- start:1271 stop:2845 length:1575 start_codon:yes stop_codon:yes gene_type:complete
MYRILSASKDTYITNKAINNIFTASDANTGQAGTIDLFKLYNESKLPGSSNVVELSRALIKFDLNPLRQQMEKDLNINDSSFNCQIKLHDVYGGQTTPSNFSLIVFPLAIPFNEGTGRDIVRYSDLGAANYITSSFFTSTGLPKKWNLPGAMKSGSKGDSNIDVIVSGNLNDGLGSRALCAEQYFKTGEENLVIDVTTAVSGMLSNQLPDYGFLIGYSGSYEKDSKTYFVKRFASRNASDRSKHPKMIVRYDDSIIDDRQNLIFNVTSSLFLNNYHQGQAANIIGSDGNELTGHNCLKLTFKSGSFTRTVNASQFSYSSAEPFLIGVYSASFAVSEYETLLRDEIVTAASATFVETWHSNDGNYGFLTGSFIINANDRITFFNGTNRILATITNLKANYFNDEIVRLRVYAEDRDRPIKALKLPYYNPSNIYNKMYYQIIDFESKEIIVPFDTVNDSTRMSTDSQGMFFNLYVESLPPGKIYQFQFLIKDKGNDQILENVAGKFKVELRYDPKHDAIDDDSLVS